MMNTRAKQFGRIGVLMGGVSSERDISLKSGRAILESLRRQGMDVVPVDITESDEKQIRFCLEEAGVGFAFIALHGALGEDGVIQSILERMHIPYTGSGSDASRLAIDKSLTQNLLKKNNIRVPAYVTLSNTHPARPDAVIKGLKTLPLVVKPAREGSSIGISLVRTEEELDVALKCAWEYGGDILVEQYIQGRELTVGILGEEALPVVEICPKHEFFDFDTKYTKGMTDYTVPARIPGDLAEEVQRAALQAHRLLGCCDFSRVDLMIDTNNQYYILEVNTIPGFTETSLLPKAALQKGLSFDQLCMTLVEMAYGKKKEIKNTIVR